MGNKTVRQNTGDFEWMWRHFRTASFAKNIYLTFPYKQRTSVPLVNWFNSSQEEENDWEICFSGSLQSWNDVTITPSLLLLASRFCTPPDMKFHVFGKTEHGEGKSLTKKIFAILMSTLGRSNWANKKISVIFTLNNFWMSCKSEQACNIN